jgi:hypothetical protein
MSGKSPSYPRRGKAIITRISVTGLNTSFVVHRGKELIGWKSRVRQLLQRESARLRRIAATNMQLEQETHQNDNASDGVVSKPTANNSEDFTMEDCEPEELLWTVTEWESPTDVWQPGNDGDSAFGLWYLR